jgi:hypothetical protein
VSTTTTPESRGRIAYTVYCSKVEFRSVNGDILPAFDDLPTNVRDAWISSANVLWDLATTGHATL